MNNKNDLGGIIHTYLGYDPVNFPSPTAPPPDLASPALEHLLLYGNTRRLTEEELANAVRIDPSQIKGLGPSLEAIAEMLGSGSARSSRPTRRRPPRRPPASSSTTPPSRSSRPRSSPTAFTKAVKEEQLHDLEHLFYAVGNDRDPFARARSACPSSSATSTRSTSWPASTSSPAARR